MGGLPSLQMREGGGGSLMDIQLLIGKRCLLKLGASKYSPVPVDEYKIIELSPSEMWVKLQNIHGNKFWKSITEISYVEELLSIEVGK